MKTMKKKVQKECYIMRSFYYGTMYYYIDVKTGEQSREYCYEGQAIDMALENGYKIIRRPQ
jgi:hypothetical protein